jgi:hypothetical protein
MFTLADLTDREYDTLAAAWEDVTGAAYEGPNDDAAFVAWVEADPARAEGLLRVTLEAEVERAEVAEARRLGLL